MGKLDGKVVMLTGAGAGLGKQSVIQLAREGARLSICDVRVDKLEETSEILRSAGAECLAIECDVSKYDNLTRYVDATVDRFGSIDVLINNANLQFEPVAFIDQNIDELERAMRTGLYSYWHLMKLCYPHLRGKSSSIINFVSGVYQIGHAGMSTYVVDKAAIRALTMVVAREWGRDGIRCNNISPFAITDTIKENLPEEFKDFVMNNAAENALGRIGDPLTDIAPVVVFLASDDSRWVTGQNINVDGGSRETISI